MGIPGSIDLSARTGLHPICDLVPAGSGLTARSDPPFAGGGGPAGRDHTVMTPLPRTVAARCPLRQIDLMGFRTVICNYD